MNTLIVGGSSGLGRRLAEACAKRGAHLLLVSSDVRDLQAVASDLTLRYGSRCDILAADMGGGDAHLDRIAEMVRRAGPLTEMLFPIGQASPLDAFGADPAEVARLAYVNYLSVVGVITRLEGRLDPRGASIVGFGSIAQVRGRRSNIAYAAAKRALASYFESLRHALSGRSVAVQFYVVGYLDTGQSHGRRTLLPRADPDRFAKLIVRRLGRDFGVAYYPFYWRWIAWALRLTPWSIFRRMDF